MNDYNPVSISMNPNQRLFRDVQLVLEEEKSSMKAVPYRQAIGSLIHT